jgi:hypothetical protein
MENAAYCFELFPAHFRLPNEEGFAERLEDELARDRDELRFWLVAEIDGQVVGQLVAHVEPPTVNAARHVRP